MGDDRSRKHDEGPIALVLYGFFAVAYLPARLFSWLTGRSEYVFGSMMNAITEIASVSFALIRLLPWRYLPAAATPFIIIVEIALGCASRLFERCEWFFGRCVVAVRESCQLLLHVLAMLPWSHLAFIVDPCLGLIGAVHERFGGVAELSEFIVGELVNALVEVATSLFKLLVTMPLMAAVWIARRVLPSCLVDRIIDKVIGIPGFCRAWISSRNTWKLLFATPALMMAIPVAACLMISQGDSPADKLLRYRFSLDEALADNNQALADLCIRRMEQLGYLRREREEFRAALLVESTEGAEAAYGRMQAISSSEDGSSFSPARLWIAQHLLNGSIGLQARDPIRLAKLHVSHVLSIEQDNVSASRLMAETHVRAGELEDAVQVLRRVADQDDLFVHSRLMQLYSARGDTRLAKASAKRVVSIFASKRARLDSISYPDYLRCVEAMVAVGEKESAVDVLRLATDRYPEEVRRDEALDRIVELGLGGNPELMTELYEICPDNLRLNDLLAKELVYREQSIRPFLRRWKEQQIPSAELLCLAGDEVARGGKFAEALRFYREACQTDASVSRAWNNIAWILANENDQLDDALAAVNRAIAAEPDPDYYDTRGQILARMGRWQAAKADLELALNGNLPDSDSTHQVLAETYHALGQANLALAHWSEAAHD